MVGHHVVQLPCDAVAFLQERAAGAFLGGERGLPAQFRAGLATPAQSGAEDDGEGPLVELKATAMSGDIKIVRA